MPHDDTREDLMALLELIDDVIKIGCEMHIDHINESLHFLRKYNFGVMSDATIGEARKAEAVIQPFRFDAKRETC